MTDPLKRLSMAFSFPGEYRQFVQDVATHLTKYFARERILYDRFYEAEFARPDLDTYLQRLYHDESELIVVFLCAGYEQKEWCGLEWRAIRDLIKQRQLSTVMPLRFDATEIPGLFSIDGYVWIGDRGPEAIANLIVERSRISRAISSDPTSGKTSIVPATRPVSFPGPYQPPIVISVHGILTAARWQKSLADTLSVHGIKHRAHDFGNYSLFRFLSYSSRQSKVEDFYDFYGFLVKEQALGISLSDYRSRPSIIAHSFGTYIIGYAMQKYPDIRFDKIILCGSILPVDFDWATLFHRDQVNFVRNEYGVQDYWTSIVGNFIRDAGASGTEGFRSLSTVVSQERFEYFNHSDYFNKQHIENHWLPVLSKEPSPLQIRHGRNMNDDTTQFVATLNETAKIDDVCFGDLPGYKESQVPRGLSTTWIEINPDIYTFLFDRRQEKVCGYINAMAVNDECFNRIQAGTIRDSDIRSGDVIPFLRNQSVKMYLMSVAIDPALRRASQGLLQEPLERLVNGFVAKLYYYAVNHHIRVTELISVGWTEPGKKLCEAFGMMPRGKDMDGHPIYRLDFDSGPFKSGRAIFPSVQRLYETYKRMP
jgi:pimeloyl-ACP methyl ester carboxylesterase